jgi:hypothetical protein
MRTAGKDSVAIETSTEWKVLRAPDFHALVTRLANKAIFGGRNKYEPVVLAEAGCPPSRSAAARVN